MMRPVNVLLLLAIAGTAAFPARGEERVATEEGDLPSAGKLRVELEAISSQMKDVSVRLQEFKLDDETRQRQKQIEKAVKDLLDQAAQQQGTAAGAPPPEEESNDPANMPPGGQSPQGDGGAGGRRRNDEENAAESSDRTEGGVPTDEERRKRRKALTDSVWGHLPPRVRDHLNRSINERNVPEYDDLVRRYYEALAEQRRIVPPAGPK